MLIRMSSTIMLLMLAGVVVGSDNSDAKVIEAEILGEQIFSLYDHYDYRKIEVDNEYADLQAGEQYWLAIDSNHEYLTIRTLDKIIVELVVRNPDLRTERGVRVGDAIEEFFAVYPDATRLTHYQTGIPRKGDNFYVDSEDMEVNFGADGVVITIRYRTVPQ